MIASNAATMAAARPTASGRSIFASTGTCQPDRRARGPHLVGRLRPADERQRHPVHTGPRRDGQRLAVAGGDRRDGQRRVGQVQPLVRLEQSRRRRPAPRAARRSIEPASSCSRPSSSSIRWPGRTSASTSGSVSATSAASTGSAASAKWIVSPAASSRGTGKLHAQLRPRQVGEDSGELADALGRLAEAGDAGEVFVGACRARS